MQTIQHDATRRESGTFRGETGETRGDGVGIHKLTEFQQIAQHPAGGRRFSSTIGTTKDDDLRRSPSLDSFGHLRTHPAYFATSFATSSVLAFPPMS